MCLLCINAFRTWPREPLKTKWNNMEAIRTAMGRLTKKKPRASAYGLPAAGHGLSSLTIGELDSSIPVEHEGDQHTA